jgi:hypothetical protein
MVGVVQIRMPKNGGPLYRCRCAPESGRVEMKDRIYADQDEAQARVRRTTGLGIAGVAESASGQSARSHSFVSSLSGDGWVLPFGLLSL